jgi:hypothetical protein
MGFSFPRGTSLEAAAQVCKGDFLCLLSRKARPHLRSPQDFLPSIKCGSAMLGLCYGDQS